MPKSSSKIIAIGKNGKNIVFMTVEDAANFFGIPENKLYKIILHGWEEAGYFFDYLFEL